MTQKKETPAGKHRSQKTARQSRRHTMAASCWCAPEYVGNVGGLETYRHHDSPDFIRSDSTPPMSAEDAAVALGERLKELRGSMPRRELAQLLRVNENFIYQMETGRSAPALGTLQALAKVFGVGMDDLLAGVTFPQLRRRK